MRKSFSLVSVVLMLSLGCGDDGKSTGDAAGSDGGNTGGEPSGEANAGNGTGAEDAGAADAGKYADCDRSQTPSEIPGYMGDAPVFTADDLKSCQTLCMGQNVECFNEDNCPGIDTWNDCAFENLISCVGSEGKACREEIETFDCCAAASGCDPESTDPTCIRTACAAEIKSFQDCYNGDAACNMSAPTACFSAPVMGGDAAVPVAMASMNMLKQLR